MGWGASLIFVLFGGIGLRVLYSLVIELLFSPLDAARLTVKALIGVGCVGISVAVFRRFRRPRKAPPLAPRR